MTETGTAIPEPTPVEEIAAALTEAPAAQTTPRRRLRSPAGDKYSYSRTREFGIPALLFLLSVVTTTGIGARFMLNFQHGLPAIAAESDLWPWPWLIAHPANFLLGWPFSVALLGILMTHEFGHYFACRAHGIRATLPWVLPAPTLSGTAGAVIQIRSRIPNRGALMDVGIYGPLPGFVASLIAVAVGFWLSPAAVASGAPDLIGFGHPLALRLVHAAVALVHPGTPAFDAALRHPILIAGWIGLFITSLNLIPGGQLDGGHILYAISPRLHRWSTRALPVVLILLGIFSWLGWIVWGLMLLIPAMRHPKVGARPALNRTRLLLGAAALVISILTFSMHPFASTSIWSYLRSL